MNNQLNPIMRDITNNFSKILSPVPNGAATHVIHEAGLAHLQEAIAALEAEIEKFKATNERLRQRNDRLAEHNELLIEEAMQLKEENKRLIQLLQGC
jgi:FtsZ-binding cell division protein ZapB